MTVKKRIVEGYEHANMLIDRSHECGLKLTLAGNVEKQYFSSERSRGKFDVFSVRSISRFARPTQKSDDSLFWHQLRRQFQALDDKLTSQKRHARNIAAGPVEAGDETKFDGVSRCGEDNGNC